MDVTAIGEILIDLTQTGVNEAGVPQFSANPGGAPANVAVAAARLGAASFREDTARMSALNAEIMGKPGTDPFFGAPTVVVVLADGELVNWLQDGSLVMGNLMTAAAATGIGSCWINRAMELFDRPEGKALLRKWGLPETLRGVGNCVLGYIDGPVPAPKPRKEGYIVRV